MTRFPAVLSRLRCGSLEIDACRKQRSEQSAALLPGAVQRRRYMALLAGSSKARLLDLRKLSASLPLPPPPAGAPPVFVLGAANDFVVDEACALGSALSADLSSFIAPRAPPSSLLPPHPLCTFTCPDS